MRMQLLRTIVRFYRRNLEEALTASALECRMPVASRPAASAAATGLVLFARALAFAVLALVALPAPAQDYTAGSLKIERPYARPTPPGARTGAVYFAVQNTGATADRLVKVASSAAQSVELHSMTMEGNLMKMRPLKALDVPAGERVTFGANGYHVMLVGLARPLAVGDQVPLTLDFEKAGAVHVFAAVEAANAGTTHRH
jgi:copper(I)-binding protein